MIKRQACAKSSNNVLPILQCHKGDGLCLVPPVVRSQQWNIRCVYKARCPACWLKMCLKCYNIPPVLRSGLNALLPPLMRDPLSISLSFGQDEDGQGQKLGSQCKLSWPSEDSLERNLFKSAMGWRNFEMGQNETNYQSAGSFLYTKIDKCKTIMFVSYILFCCIFQKYFVCLFEFMSNNSFVYFTVDSSMSISPNKKRRKNNRIKVRRKIKSPVLASTNNQYPQSLRQRVELKGPRVKHVCRSASVALGQPIATFPTADAKEDDEHGKNIPKSAKELERIEKKDEVTKEKEMHKHNEDNNFNLNVAQQSHSRRGKPQQIVSTSHFPVVKYFNILSDMTYMYI